MIDKIDNNQIQDLSEKLSSRQHNSAGTLSNIGEDVSVQVDYASLIDKAAQTPQTDTRDVQRAQELLLSGQLETPENIREAAEDIIKFGI